MMAAVIPGIGVCKYCDATSVPRGCFGAGIDGGKCLGCGAPVYILEHKKPEAAMLIEDDTPPRTIVPAVNEFAYIRQREKEIAAEREAAKPRELEYPAGA